MEAQQTELGVVGPHLIEDVGWGPYYRAAIFLTMQSRSPMWKGTRRSLDWGP